MQPPTVGIGNVGPIVSVAAAQPVSIGMAAELFLMMFVPAMQTRFTLSVTPELTIAAGFAVDRTWISQSGALIVAPELSRNA